ncbi:hypothetical protein MRB53_002905 [Persea americana]|uniref:Uncharacterized protein n=1 Tax=Persea americana TaxID=3435 RepID=A0ACC2MVU9_PERAE|nr:hypothetical protein MRB53_002905 [Persea americana]
MHMALSVLLSILVGFFSLTFYFYYIVWLRPERIREKLRKQGIRGPRPSFFYGNIQEMKKIESTAKKGPRKHQHLEDSYVTTLFPYFEKWREEYGPIFTYSTGKEPLLYVSDPDMVKELNLCKSGGLGKPTYVQKERRALFGHGILASNGSAWAHQRKVIAPEFFMDKVKGMVDLMVECTIPMLKSWEHRIETEGVIGDVRVDEDLIGFSADVISRACFGSSYSNGKEIFSRLRAIQHEMAKAGILIGLPGLRYLPTKRNRVVWMLDREVQSLILKVIKGRQEESMATPQKGRDLLQTLIENAHSRSTGLNAANSFIVDNCKSIYFAGHETTAISATWGLMLLASNPEWQARARAEVQEVCGGQLPDADMLRRMKILTMVIQETLRLYPPSTFIPREALQDMKLGKFQIPKGTNLWIPVPTLHRDPEIWGPDAHEFNPGRFSDGIIVACKLPHMYIPFGIGARMCPGQNLAMAELKVVLSLILSRFSFSLSPSYCHSPAFRMVIEPEFGLNLLMRRV